MNGNDLISLASALATNRAFGNAEARYRSAISRAYYGAFHIVVDFLHELSQEPDLVDKNLRVPANNEGHHQAYVLLFNTAVPEAVEAARSLDELRGHRNDADYKLHRRGFDSQANAMDKVEMALDISNQIADCRSIAKRPQVIAAIRSS